MCDGLDNMGDMVRGQLNEMEELISLLQGYLFVNINNAKVIHRIAMAEEKRDEPYLDFLTTRICMFIELKAMLDKMDVNAEVGKKLTINISNEMFDRIPEEMFIDILKSAKEWKKEKED